MNFEEWWAYKQFGFGTKWLEPIAKSIAEEVWNAALEETAKVAEDMPDISIESKGYRQACTQIAEKIRELK